MSDEDLYLYFRKIMNERDKINLMNGVYFRGIFLPKKLR